MNNKSFAEVTRDMNVQQCYEKIITLNNYEDFYKTIWLGRKG